RQWIRHRTACLAADTQVHFDLPGGIERRGNQLYKLTLREIWDRFQPTRNASRPDKQRNPWFRRDRVRAMRLRQVDEETGRIRHTRIVDIFRNGPKPVFRMVLADGKTIRATADHRFLFADGWSTLKEKTGLEERSGRAVWKQGDYFVHVNGLVCEEAAPYADRDWLDHEYNGLGRSPEEIADDCGCSPHTIRSWLRRHAVRDRRGRGRFKPGDVSWNRGRTYTTGPRVLSDEHRETILRTRAGPASNFWKGGTSSERESVGRWTTQAAPRVHARHGWTCQLCHGRADELHCHHVVPVWADPSLSRDESNLTTLCGSCHRRVNGRELEFVDRLGGPPVRAEWSKKRRPRTAWNRLERSRLVRIERFEYAGIEETYDLEVEGPFHNFVANGIITHNSVNEYSGRYSLMPLLFYRPEYEQFALQAEANRQGRDAAAAEREIYDRAVAWWDESRRLAGEAYGWLVERDVARELARIDLPLSTYTQWYWKVDLHNLMHFLSLRVDPHAQWEIRQYAGVMAGMLKRVAPLSYEAWLDYEVRGTWLSGGELDALRDLVEADDADGSVRARDGARVDAPGLEAKGLSKREVRELVGKLGPRERPDFALDLSQMRPAEEFEARMRRAVPGEFE
ncbi:MAG: FAD-dependent thymidylate synthase, partial [Gemmatimonadota bacterium]